MCCLSIDIIIRKSDFISVYTVEFSVVLWSFGKIFYWLGYILFIIICPFILSRRKQDYFTNEKQQKKKKKKITKRKKNIIFSSHPKMCAIFLLVSTRIIVIEETIIVRLSFHVNALHIIVYGNLEQNKNFSSF